MSLGYVSTETSRRLLSDTYRSARRQILKTVWAARVLISTLSEHLDPCSVDPFETHRSNGASSSCLRHHSDSIRPTPDDRSFREVGRASAAKDNRKGSSRPSIAPSLATTRR
ncbi:hypothetical protein BD311DRAFT_5455 [Dichomitus squalens]|uniref:Uncharacterized protein n=1 Tax=Dichomitus squalens TaxID=114155 RepID=A0A4Q9N663_9APHY|nr:hypothetical protein BD311DRAFT_5455 [Dichomitus squalens]